MNLRLRPREFPRTGKCSTSPSCFFRGAISRITISRTTIFRFDDNLVVSIHADLSVHEIPTSVGKDFGSVRAHALTSPSSRESLFALAHAFAYFGSPPRVWGSAPDMFMPTHGLRNASARLTIHYPRNFFNPQNTLF